MRLIKLLPSVGLSLLCLLSYGQSRNFHFRSKVSDISAAGWYSIFLPDSIFPYISREMRDLRIYQVKNADTLEAPYLLKVLESENTGEVVDLKMVNRSTKDGKLYFTFEAGKDQHVNYLDLEFEEENFNGYAQLEGSADQKEWFTIDSLKRILAVHHDRIDFKSTQLMFPETTFPFLRLIIKADRLLTLENASFKKRQIKAGLYTKADVKLKKTNDKKIKQTVVNVTLRRPSLVSKVCIAADHSLDFYRPMVIEVLRDSAKTPKDYVYYYDNVFSGTITSVDERCFEFSRVMAKKIRITITNADNAPLEIRSVEVFGPMVELIARLEPGDNYLYYGNNDLAMPSYDIIHFAEKIPQDPQPLTISHSENLLHPTIKTSPLLESKVWLWLAMGIVIAVLGYFTFRMMRTAST